MRAAILFIVFATSCTPDIVSGAYLCGRNSACPSGQSCNGPDNTCVLSSTATGFECTPDMETEPDDTAAQAHQITGLGCVSVPYIDNNCMMQGDSEDWVRFTAPAACASVEVQARVSFPYAFERLGLELWNIDANTKLVEDTACPVDGQAGEELRCIEMTLTPGTSYGIRVRPAGDGNCGGNCAYNRYTLRVLLATP